MSSATTPHAGVSLREFRSLDPDEQLALRHLHDGCHDSRLGLEDAIRLLGDHPLRPRLHGWVCDRSAMADLLETALRLNAVVPGRRGTTMGALRRAWHHVRGAVGHAPPAVLQGLERQERALVGAYELELARLGPVGYRETLEAHLRVVLRTCEALAELRADLLQPV